MVLASLPRRGWEEQFGMVLAEALASGTSILAARSGAIPEVVEDAALFDPGMVRPRAGAARGAGWPRARGTRVPRSGSGRAVLGRAAADRLAWRLSEAAGFGGDHS